MSYLTCNKCGRCYKLHEGESPNDFSNKCECGGTLRHVKYLEEKTLKLKSIGTGVLIITLIFLTTFYIIPNWYLMTITALFTLIIGSFVTSYTSSVKYKSRIVNGIFAAVIAGCVLFAMVVVFKPFTLKISGEFILFISIVLISALLGLIGSLTAIAIKTGKMKLDWKLFGGGVAFTIILLFFSSSLLSPIIGGFFIGRRTKENYWEGIKHGFTGSLGISIILIIATFTNLGGLKNKLISDLTVDSIITFILILILVFIVGGILGSIGGLIGTAVEKNRKKYVTKFS